MARPLSYALILCFTVAVRSLAQESFCNQYLIPVPLGEVAGANGSLWSTEMWVRNDSDASRRVFRRTCEPYLSGCRYVSVPDTAVPPRTTLKLNPLPGREGSAIGEFLYVDDPADVVFQIRTRDKAQNATSAGTSIPGGRLGSHLRFSHSLHAVDRPPSPEAGRPYVG